MLPEAALSPPEAKRPADLDLSSETLLPPPGTTTTASKIPSVAPSKVRSLVSSIENKNGGSPSAATSHQSGHSVSSSLLLQPRRHQAFLSDFAEETLSAADFQVAHEE